MPLRTVTPGRARAPTAPTAPTATAAGALCVLHTLGLLAAAPLAGAQQRSLPGVPDSVMAPMDSIEGLLAAEPGPPNAPELLYRLGRLKTEHLPRINIALIDIPGDSVRFATEAEHAALEAYVGEHLAEYHPLGIPGGGYEYNGWHFGELVRRFPHHALAEEAAYRFAVAGPGHEAQLLRRTTRFLRERSGSGYAPRVIGAVNEILERMASAYLDDPWWDTRGVGGYHYTFEPVQPLIPEYDDVVRALPARVRRPALPTLAVLWTALGCRSRADRLAALIERDLPAEGRARALERLSHARERAGDRSCLDLREDDGQEGDTPPPESDPPGCDRVLSTVNSGFHGGRLLVIEEMYAVPCYPAPMLVLMRAWTYDGLDGDPLWTISPGKWGSYRPEEWAGLYLLPALLCCGDSEFTPYTFYSPATGERLFVSSESVDAGRIHTPLRIRERVEGESAASRFVAYHGADAGGGYDMAPPEANRDGVIGVLQYGDDRNPAARYPLHAPGYHVAALRLRATRGTLDDDARELRLEAAADRTAAAIFDGFSVVLELRPRFDGGRPAEGAARAGPSELVIPVEADRLVVEQARGPEGVRLEASREESSTHDTAAPGFERAAISGVRRFSDDGPCERGLDITNTEFTWTGREPMIVVQETYRSVCPHGARLVQMRAWTYEGLADEPLWTISPDWASRRPTAWRQGYADIYRIPAMLCCADTDFLVVSFYSSLTGHRLFVASESGEAGRLLEDATLRVIAWAGNWRARFVAYHGSDAGGSAVLAPPEAEHEGVIGVLQYGDDRHPAARYALHAPGYHVAALRLRAMRGTLDDDAQELRLRAAANAEESAAFGGFSVVMELVSPISTIRGKSGPVPDGPVELVIPVEADRLVVERASAPEGVRLEASPEEKRRRAP